MIYSKLKQIDETLKEVISTTLNDGLINSINSNFEKEKVKLMNLMQNAEILIAQKIFYQSINSFMKSVSNRKEHMFTSSIWNKPWFHLNLYIKT